MDRGAVKLRGEAGTRGRIWLAGAVVVLAALAAYRNSLSGEFIFDDVTGITDNPTIRHLWPLGPVLLPPHEGGVTVGGRPLVNLSLALNYAFGGEAPRGYHLFNLVVHALAALTLFGLVRRTLHRPVLRDRFAPAATGLALAVAALWAVHPLLTESVSYVIQRAESLMGLFYLPTLYAFVRGTDFCGGRENTTVTGRASGRCWLALAVVACALGMATKEVMATAPLMVLWYDRTFVAGTFRAAWRARRGFYLALAATWIPLALLVASTGGNRGGTVGLGVGVAWWAYPLTQFKAIATYLGLAFWPRSLLFEHGTFWVHRAGDVLPYAAVVGPLLVATAIAVWRWPVAGFVGAWFFAILAPSSLTPGTAQMIVEHRMYLSLAAVVVVVVLALHVWLGRWAGMIFAILAVASIGATNRRNDDYRTALALWTDTVAKSPGNALAHTNLADALLAGGDVPAALEHYATGIRLGRVVAEQTGRSLLGPMLIDYGNALLAAGRADEALVSYEAALQEESSPDTVVLAHYDAGCVLMEAGRLPEAEKHFEAALQLQPDYAPAHNNLASVLLREGRAADAIAHYETALRLQPSAKAHFNLGNALRQAKRLDEANAHFAQAMRMNPDTPELRRALEEAMSSVRK